MPPTLALLLWFILLVALWRFDPAKERETSPALWLPLIWMVIKASRLPSQWFGLGGTSAYQAYQEGNVFDRTILSLLILLAVGVLVSRSFQWGGFITRNFALTLFIAYALLSVFWSEFPLISLKRWIRDLGNYVMVLVVLTDPSPWEALRTLLRRLAYLLVPLSILLIKYFPELGMGYSRWTGDAYFEGVATTKNMLGAICLVSGIFFFWDTVMRWADRKDLGTKRTLQVNAAFLVMTLWLLRLSHSATSTLCLGIGCLIIAATHSNFFRRNPAGLKVLIPATLCLVLVLELGFGISSAVAGAVGRDPTLTNRTELWNIVLSEARNPLFGAGYESFWLGTRLREVWREFSFGINQAHNGYLEVYLNLGIVGVILLIGFLIGSYWNICKKTRPLSLTSLGLALWMIMLFYNVTEAAFKSHLMWLIFLLVALSVPGRTENQLAAEEGAFSPAQGAAANGGIGKAEWPRASSRSHLRVGLPSAPPPMKHRRNVQS